MEENLYGDETCPQCGGKLLSAPRVGELVRMLIKVVGRAEVKRVLRVDHDAQLSMLLSGKRRWRAVHMERLVPLRKKVAGVGGIYE